MESAAALDKKTCPQCGGRFEVDAVFCPRDGAKLLGSGDATDAPGSPDSYVGVTVAGDFEIRGVAGGGAMGRVYRAHQRGIERDVAVKILHRELSGNQHLVQRFHREGKIASRLKHPHVVEVYLAGQLPDGALYIVMEYLDGASLATALEEAGGLFPIERAISIALQIADAVGEGHARGIVHRDLKPENVMLVERADAKDFVKVLDFGIAKVNLGEQSMETAAGLIFGTARYISPEGAQGTAVGPPGDVYSLATMVFQMLAGRTPFAGEAAVGLLIKQIHDPPPDLAELAPSVPAPIVRVVMDNLAKDPQKRAQNGRAFGNALAAAARAAHVSFADVGVAARMSAVDLRGPALDPTLDDVSGVTGPPPRPPPATAPTPAAGAPAVAPTVSDPPIAQTSIAPAEARYKSPRFVILLAFLLGVTIAVIVTQQIARRGEAERAAYLEKTSLALAEGRFVSPPSENVKDLVAAGLVKWPNDARLSQLRADAAHEMVTRSMAAHSAGDIGGARDLAKNALLLNPADHSAKILSDQYDDELGSLGTPAGAANGTARVLFDTPARAKAGATIEVSAKVFPRSSGPQALVSGATARIYDNGKTTGGRPIPLVQKGKDVFKGTTTAPATGSYDVVFEVTVDARLLRAERDLDVE